MYYFKLENLKTGIIEGILVDEFNLSKLEVETILDIVTRKDIYIVQIEGTYYILDIPSQRFIKEFKRKK